MGRKKLTAKQIRDDVSFVKAHRKDPLKLVCYFRNVSPDHVIDVLLFGHEGQAVVKDQGLHTSKTFLAANDKRTEAITKDVGVEVAPVIPGSPPIHLKSAQSMAHVIAEAEEHRV